jgi:hypothetical protein
VRIVDADVIGDLPRALALALVAREPRVGELRVLDVDLVRLARLEAREPRPVRLDPREEDASGFAKDVEDMRCRR